MGIHTCIYNSKLPPKSFSFWGREGLPSAHLTLQMFIVARTGPRPKLESGVIGAQLLELGVVPGPKLKRSSVGPIGVSLQDQLAISCTGRFCVSVLKNPL